MNRILLSVCVPTYNFGGFIGEMLDSVISQADDRVEIVIVDGASCDDTEEVIRGYLSRFNSLRYYRMVENGGLDADLARTVRLARGEYCWLLSSDDALQPGAIRRVIHESSQGHSIYLFNRTEADLALRAVRNRWWLPKRTPDRVFEFRNTEDWLAYLREARSLGALFSYMSSIVVQRSAWMKAKRDPALEGSNYAHVSSLVGILKDGGSLKYVRDQLVWCRGGNDSFLSEGVVRRYSIDIYGYHRLAWSLFPEDGVLRRAFLSVVKREHPLHMWFRVRSRVEDEGQWEEFERLLLECGYNSLGLRMVRRLGASSRMVEAIRWANRFVQSRRKKRNLE